MGDDGIRCWICFEDEKKGSGMRWVSPCKCKSSLKYVHEACLLKWIAEKEGVSNEVKCPACAYPYRIEETKDLVLSTLTFIDKSLQKTVPYFALAGVSTALYVVSTTYGAYALVTMCGIEEGERILSENWGWRTWVGLPLIPIGLISSRLRRAGSLLPLMPFVILGGDQIRLTLPPSPAMTICLLPWARFAYNGAWTIIETLNRATTSQPADPTPDDDDENDTLFVGPRQGQSLILGSLLLPAVSSFIGNILGYFSFIRTRIPDVFHQNVLGGFAFVLMKDIARYVYKHRKKANRRTRTIKNYIPE